LGTWLWSLYWSRKSTRLIISRNFGTPVDIKEINPILKKGKVFKKINNKKRMRNANLRCKFEINEI
jgi:hypothetical protein